MHTKLHRYINTSKPGNNRVTHTGSSRSQSRSIRESGCQYRILGMRDSRIRNQLNAPAARFLDTCTQNKQYKP